MNTVLQIVKRQRHPKLFFILAVPHSAPGPMGTLYSLNQILYIGGGLYCNRGVGVGVADTAFFQKNEYFY